MPTIRQSSTLTAGSASTNDGTLAIRAMGTRHHGTIPHRKTPTQVSRRCDRLLHQMGGSRATSNHHREERSELRMEGSDLQVWDPVGAHIRQRETIRQSQIQAILPRIRHP